MALSSCFSGQLPVVLLGQLVFLNDEVDPWQGCCLCVSANLTPRFDQILCLTAREAMSTVGNSSEIFRLAGGGVVLWRWTADGRLGVVLVVVVVCRVCCLSLSYWAWPIIPLIIIVLSRHLSL